MSRFERFDNVPMLNLFRPPRRGRANWILLVLAVLYSVVGIVTLTPVILVGIPLVLLWTIPEVLPERNVRLAGYFRVAGLLYIFLTPIIYLLIS